jgi:hypothetical protein
MVKGLVMLVKASFTIGFLVLLVNDIINGVCPY